MDILHMIDLVMFIVHGQLKIVVGVFMTMLFAGQHESVMIKTNDINYFKPLETNVLLMVKHLI